MKISPNSEMKCKSQTTRRGWVLVTVGLSAVLVACNATQQAPDKPDEETREEITAADVKQEIDEAMRAIEAYAYENKGDFETWSKERLAAIDSELDALRAEIEGLGDDVRTRWDETFRALEARRKALDTELDETLESTEDAWLELQAGFIEAQEELSVAIDRAASELTDDEGSEEEQ